MELSDALKAYSKVFKLLKSRELTESEQFTGFIELCPTHIEDIKTLLLYNLCDTSVDLFKEGKLQTSVGIDDLAENHYPFDCKLSISSQWERAGYYVGANWDLLLKSAARVLKPITQAFFTDTEELTSSASLQFHNYLKLSKVCNLIDQVALPANESKTRTVIFERDISIHYTLKLTDLEHHFCIKAVERLLHEDIHHDAKSALVREALVKFLKDKGTNQRFGYLISHFNAFSSELMLSYQAYVEQYTFDKVRKEYQEKQTEYIQKINDSYSDIGAKVLAIPAGLWLAVFKLEEATVGSFGFIKNLIILMLCLLCMCYVIFHFFSQFSVLDSIKTEYQSLFDRLAQEHEEESQSIIEAKRVIDKNASWAWRKLTLSNFATIVVFIMVMTLSWYSIVTT